MIDRGKYQSLTMINWNGFFARTFDIDELVTTLSGGNGAGKSTTMAAFIAALIPDQSLLHFRNTTEAGSSQASQDKGLFGKLQPGVCFAALDVVNSKKQRVLFGVRLQQIAGRDKKVDIKPFLIQGLPSHLKPTDMLIETLSENRARVRPLNEVKQATSELDGVLFKPFNSIVDYHSQMFELGVLPKKLRNSSDRSKFYRLIEASLYGGISSAITRSLRDYLLPVNGGVKKAFQDMESALRENRITLEAIKATQADRDLFKNLITESTNYVASDYMRHTNDRRKRLEKTLSLRAELYGARVHLTKQHTLFNAVQNELQQLQLQESDLEMDHQAASDHLQLVQSALKHKEKIERYLDDLTELGDRLEEQMTVVEESHEEVCALEQQSTDAEQEVDSLQMQLADYQKALDVQQTRALQYQQAEELLEKVREIFSNKQFELENLAPTIAKLKVDEEKQTQKLLTLERQLDIFTAKTGQFDTGFDYVKSVYENVDRTNVYRKAKEAISSLKSAELTVAGENHALAQLKEKQADIVKQKQAFDIRDTYKINYQSTVYSEECLEKELATHHARLDVLEIELEKSREVDIQKRQYLLKQKERLSDSVARAPSWIKANNELLDLREQSEQDLTSNQAIMLHMQTLLEREKQLSANKDKLASRRDAIDIEIKGLASQGGASDPRLQEIADLLGGVLLSEIYDDIALEDAPYFSAMYGPARNAIVVSSFLNIKEKLARLTDCPEDIYIIQGDVNAFDDSSFNADELEGAVLVQSNDRQYRYSTLPEVPLFGRAARDLRLEQLREERDEVVENHAKAAFDSQKLLRLYQRFVQFASSYLEHAFENDPEKEIELAKKRIAKTQEQLEQVRTENDQQKFQIANSKQAIALLDRLAPLVDYLGQDTLLEQRTEVERILTHIETEKRFIREHKVAIEQLDRYLPVLQTDPQQEASVKSEHRQIDEQLQRLKQQQFLLADLDKRRRYFSYRDSVAVLSHSNELTEQLKKKLTVAESQRSTSRSATKLAQTQYNQFNQVLASLKSTYQAKSETIAEFKQELDELGVNADENIQQSATNRKNELAEQLTVVRNKKSDHQRTIVSAELQIKSIVKTVKRAAKEYKEIRNIVVMAKANWCDVIKLAKINDVDRRLHRRELAYLSADELRSMSDKSLGALRIAVAGNTELRDALRASEDNAYPVRKIMFYIAIYQFLKQRIRQDIIRTDDPVEAIEEMEVELGRLSEELSLREQRLAISSDSVASIIKKTILREQNRIRILNQGLCNINFGQVNGVRLNVNVRESHETLLNGLAYQQNQHRDLFESSRYTFSEAMAKLFQRVNPHIDMGQRSPQVLGEELLDYRSYLELSVEVNRGSDGWLQAESGALSTGEAIGTGQSILLMVIQSWEEESRRLRSKDIIPCRLLFLDEAARLDSKSISTLFELCDRLDMQLLIAAPENISPEKGTTYKLVRKVFKDHEHVHVVGLRGFGTNTKALDSKTEVVTA